MHVLVRTYCFPALAATTLLITGLLGGCTKPLKLPDIKRSSKIVLLGELTANDTVYFRGGQSIPVASGSSLSFALPNQLSIQLTDTTGIIVALGSYIDAHAQKLHTLPYFSPQLVLANRHYTVDAYDPALGAAKCRIKVPPAFLAEIADTASVFVNGLSLLRVRIQVYDNANEANYYTVEGVKEFMSVDGTFQLNNINYKVSANRNFYDSLLNNGVPLDVDWDTVKRQEMSRIPIYTDDEHTENVKIGNAQSAARRILLSDRTINGQVYTTQVYLDKEQFLATSDSTKGQILLKVKSVSEEYFKYLQAYELFEPSGNFNSIAQPVEIPGNVENGLGIIGGVYLIQFRYLYDKWYE